MITVISQDRKVGIKSNVFVLDGKKVRAFSSEFRVAPSMDDNGIDIGAYDTAERAKEVLNQLTKIMSTGPNRLFKMPAR